MRAAPPPHLEAPPPDLAALILEHAYPIRFESGNWSGAGGELVMEAAANAQFVGLAEPHNVREIPGLTGGLLAQLRQRYGFDHLALEQGASILEQACRVARDDGPPGVVALAARYPHSFQFSTDQELGLIGETCAAPIDEPVWGLDREVALPHVFAALQKLVAGESVRTRIATLKARAEAAATADDYGAEVAIVTPAVLDELAGYFGGQPAAATSLQALRRFHDYGVWQLQAPEDAAAGYRANLTREQELKEAFAASYRRAQEREGPAPRVLVRTGHWHIARGFGPGGVLTLGNFLVELAASSGKDAFLINIQVVNEPGRFWTITDYPEYAALFGVADPSRSTLIDLRPLRPEVFGVEPEGMTPTMRDLIRQFDAVLLIGGASQGTWEWHFETIPAEATWNGTLELPDGQRLTIAVRGDEGQGRPRPVAARLPDGTIVHFTDAQYDGDQLRFAAMPESGGRFQCRLDPTPAGYDGACSSPEATLRLYIHFEPGRRAR